MRVVGDVVDGEFAEFVHDPNAGIVSAEFDCVKCAEGNEARHELEEGMLQSNISFMYIEGDKRLYHLPLFGRQS